jgi:non-specific serine/threonine protein kinase
VLDVVSSLVDKSLLFRTEEADGEPRLWMLETIREFGLEQLERCGETATARRAHASYYVAFAERQEPAFIGPGQTAVLLRLDAEQANLRAALNWLASAGTADGELRLATALYLFWFIRGHLREGRAMLEHALSRTVGVRSALRATGLLGVASLALVQGDYRAADAFWRESEATAREVGAIFELATALHGRGMVAGSLGAADEARAHFEEAIALFREIGDNRYVPFAIVNLGVVAFEQGNYDRAESLLTEGLRQHRAAGNGWGPGFALSALGDLAAAQGDYPRAAVWYREGVSSWWEQGDRRGVAGCLAGLAAVAGLCGAPKEAARLFGAADAIVESLGTLLAPGNRPRYEAGAATARSALGEDAFAAERAAGKALQTEAAIAEAAALEIAVQAANTPASAPRPFGLTRREFDVFLRLAQGDTDKEIADGLFISPRTVGAHVTAILAKLGVTSRREARAVARRHGLR